MIDTSPLPVATYSIPICEKFITEVLYIYAQLHGAHSFILDNLMTNRPLAMNLHSYRHIASTFASSIQKF